MIKRPLIADERRVRSSVARGTDDTLPGMVSAANFFATADDENSLLDYLGEPKGATLHPWPVCDWSAKPLDRPTVTTLTQVMIANAELGPPRIITRDDDPALQRATRAALFNRMNRERFTTSNNRGLIDPNSSPVLLWQRGLGDGALLRQSAIGTQADSPGAISTAYERWATRVLAWVRSRGTRVWGLEAHAFRPDLDIDIDHISSVYALPGALAALEAGTQGRR